MISKILRRISSRIKTWAENTECPDWVITLAFWSAAILAGAAGLLVIGGGILGILLAMCLLYPLMGALAGWGFGWLFDETAIKLLAILNVDIKPWELGAMLGFVGGFFKTVFTSSGSSDAVDKAVLTDIETLSRNDQILMKGMEELKKQVDHVARSTNSQLH